MSDENKDLPVPGEDAEDQAGEAEGFQSVVEKLGKQKPELVREMIAFMGSGMVSNPLHEKMDQEHITQILTLAADHDEREYNLHKADQDSRREDNKNNRRYFFWSFIVIVIVFGYIVQVFKDNPDVLIPIITGFAGLGGGFLGGWGYGKSK